MQLQACPTPNCPLSKKTPNCSKSHFTLSDFKVSLKETLVGRRKSISGLHPPPLKARHLDLDQSPCDLFWTNTKGMFWVVDFNFWLVKTPSTSKGIYSNEIAGVVRINLTLTVHKGFWITEISYMISVMKM